jgi:hypothetical protein
MVTLETNVTGVMVTKQTELSLGIFLVLVEVEADPLVI